MTDIINLLPDNVANQIAAGEVVQRPSSVIKELLENSIDAGATEIDIVIEKGGKKNIKVIDNGTGMSVKDSKMAFERHATSKIKNADELFSIQTNGFRGEALSSICAISQVELISKSKSVDLGVKINLEGNKLKNEKMLVAPIGTSISVKNLFFNIPARRNFLKSDSVELKYIINEFYRIAISYPHVSFKFINNSSEIYNLTPSNLRKRITSIFGNKIDEKLVPVKEKTSVVEIHGFILKPDFSKKTKGNQFFYVNNRYIKSSFLHHSILTSYEGLIKENYKPGYFLFFKVKPETIDINIHPTKTEIKFDNEQILYSILKSCVKHSLGMFNISPSIDFNYNNNLDNDINRSRDLRNLNVDIKVDSGFNPFINDDVQSKNISETDNTFIKYESKQIQDFNETFFDIDKLKNSAKVFQFMNKYIVSTVKSGIIIIHQTRAHQRVLYELFLKNMTQSNVKIQKLAFPIYINLSDEMLMLYVKYSEEIKASGFLINKKNKKSLEIKGIPVDCKEENIEGLLEDVLESLQAEIFNKNFSQSDVLAKVLAKKLSIKSNISLKIEEQEKLLDDLFSCKEILISPFEKKIFFNLTIKELEKKFSL
ncbi:MAG: DNA mismatch repair endonuclease MutL [Flavobacteriaceae bacterium]